MLDINVTTLKTILANVGYKDIKPLGGESFGIVVAPTKVEKLIPELAKIFAAYKPKVVSNREIRIGRFVLHAKNRDQQRGIRKFTFGRGNEFNFIGALKEYQADYGKPLTVKFIGPQATFTTKNIVKIEHTGAKNVFQRHKADAHLIDVRGQHYPVSLKDDSASFWESADTYWGEKSAKFLHWALQTNETSLIDNGAGGVSLKPTIAVPATTQETRDVVFGADIFGHGAVLVKKFTPDSFQWNDARDMLSVTCTDVITSIEQVRGGHEVYFWVRNERGRNPKHLQKGLRVMAAMKRTLYGVKVFGDDARSKAGLN